MAVISFALMPLIEYVRTHDWRETPATLEAFSWQDNGRGLARLFPAVNVRYRYVIDDTAYFGTRFGVHGGVERDRERVSQRYGSALKAGSVIQVWVDPGNPDRALMMRSLDWRLVALGFPALMACVLGALMIVLGMMSWTARSLFEELGPATVDDSGEGGTDDVPPTR